MQTACDVCVAKFAKLLRVGMGAWGSRMAGGSDDEDVLDIDGRLGTEVLDAVAVVVAEEIEAEAVFGGVVFIFELTSARDPLGVVDIAFEDRILDADAMVEADLGDSAKASASLRGDGGNVVTDNDHHDSPPEERGIGIKVAAEMPGKEKRLDMEEHADGYAFLKERVADLLLLALLPGDEEGLAAVVVHFDGPGGGRLEALAIDLPEIDQGEDNPVGEEGAELLHEVEGEAGASGPKGMVEAHLRVEADGLERPDGVMGEDCVDEREQGVKVVERWAAAALAHKEALAVTGDEGIEDGEVELGGIALDAAQGIRVGDHRNGLENVAEPVDGLGHGLIGVTFGMIAQGTLEDSAAIGDLAEDEIAGDQQGCLGIVHAPALLAPQQDIAGLRPDDPGQEASMLGEEGEVNTPVGAETHEVRAAGDLSKGDNAAQGMDGKAEALLALHVDDDAFAVLVEIGALGGDEEGVEEFFHGDGYGTFVGGKRIGGEGRFQIANLRYRITC